MKLVKNKNYKTDQRCTPNELKARKMLRSAMRRRVELSDVLHCTLDGPSWESRAALMERVGREWDTIHNIEREAHELDPQVDDKSWISRGTVNL